MAAVQWRICGWECYSETIHYLLHAIVPFGSHSEIPNLHDDFPILSASYAPIYVTRACYHFRLPTVDRRCTANAGFDRGICFHYGGRAQCYTKSMNCSHYTEKGWVRIFHCEGCSMVRIQEDQSCLLSQENFPKDEEHTPLCKPLENCQRAGYMSS